MTRFSCADFLAELGNLLDGKVSAEVRRELEAHLLDCQECEVIYDSMRKTIRIVVGAKLFDLTAEQLKSDSAAIMRRILKAE